MTDRIRTLTVILDRDMRDDDVEVVKQAVQMVKRVASVQNGEVVGGDEHMRRTIALNEFIRTQYQFLGLFGYLSGKEAEEKMRRIKEILGGPP